MPIYFNKKKEAEKYVDKNYFEGEVEIKEAKNGRFKIVKKNS